MGKGRGGGGEKWTSAECILKVVLIGLDEIFGIGCERKRGIKMIPALEYTHYCIT